VRRAAQRKLEHELGIPTSQVSLDAFQYLTRIHYLAPSDGMWGEHESESRLMKSKTVAARQLADAMNLRASRLHSLPHCARHAGAE
jgi:isopentenyl-diphosphate delta-isomerase